MRLFWWHIKSYVIVMYFIILYLLFKKRNKKKFSWVLLRSGSNQHITKHIHKTGYFQTFPCFRLWRKQQLSDMKLVTWSHKVSFTSPNSKILGYNSKGVKRLYPQHTTVYFTHEEHSIHLSTKVVIFYWE